MLELVDAFRIRYAGHPLPLTAAAALPLFLILWSARAHSQPAAAGRRMAPSRLAAGLGIAITAAYVLLATWYGTHEAFFDAAEPTMTAIGWLFAVGKPVYHAVDAADRYAHVYGPLAFAVHGAAMRLVGPGILVSKAVGVVAALAALTVTRLAIRRRTTGRRAVILVGACALAFLMFRHYTYWPRPEPFLLLVVALALFLADRGGAVAGGVGIGLLMGVAAGFKFTGPLYLLPALVVLAQRTGATALICAAVVAPVVAWLPFAWPNVSLTNYLAWIRLSASNGIEISTLLHNAEWVAFLALPWLVIRGWQRAGVAEGALAAAIAGVVIAGAKPGAGSHHLLPFVPTLAWFAARTWGSTDRRVSRPAASWLAASAAVACAIAFAQEASFVSVLRPRIAVDAASDVRAFLHGHPGDRVAMGAGGTDPLTFTRPLLVFASGSYPIDVPAIQEHNRAGVDVPAATIASLRGCTWDVWLLPAGAEPFNARNQYRRTANARLFPEAFRDAFRETYVRDGSTRYYDVWRCRRRSR